MNTHAVTTPMGTGQIVAEKNGQITVKLDVPVKGYGKLVKFSARQVHTPTHARRTP